MLHEQEETALLSGSFLRRGSIHICPCNKGTAVFVFMVMTKWTTRSAIYQASILAHCSLMGSVFSIPCGLVVQPGPPPPAECGGKMMDAFTAKLYINIVCVYLRDSHWASWRMKEQTFGCCSRVLTNQLRQNSTLWDLLILEAELWSPGGRFLTGAERLRPAGRRRCWLRAGRSRVRRWGGGRPDRGWCRGGRFSAATRMWTQRKWGLPPAPEVPAPQIKSQESCWALAAP